MSSGWFMTISLQKSDRFEEEKEHVKINAIRTGDKVLVDAIVGSVEIL